jgi:membrane protein required for colicin V production
VNWADWTIVAIVGFSTLISVIRGFVREALSLLAWIAALVVAMLFFQPVSGLFQGVISSPAIQSLAAWLTLFVGTLLVGSLVNYLFGKLVKATGLSGTDRLLGMLFGIGRGAVVVLALLMVLPVLVTVEQIAWWQNSVLIPHFLQFENWAWQAVLMVQDFFKQLF